ncbi:MAG: RHS repeat-associated core domain-containing protein [Bacteroidota bacterium]
MINHWKSFGLDEGKGASNRTSEQIDMGGTATLGTAAHNNLNQLTSVAGGGQMRVSGTLDEPATVSVSANGASAVDASVDGSNNFEASVDVNEGSNTLSISATDYSGNDNTATNNYTVQVTGPGNKTLTYDLNGNLLNDGDKTYTWDAENRLIKITYADSSSTEFEYNGWDERTRIIEKDSGGVEQSNKTYVWEYGKFDEERDSTGTQVEKRFLAQGIEVVGAASPDDKLFYTWDHLGNTRELVDDNQVVRARYNYDPYGRITKVSGDLDSDFLYTGHYYHEKSQLSLAWFRAYDADLGRWISRDPIGYDDGPNIYGYVQGNPINYWDKDGRKGIGRNVGRHLEDLAKKIEKLKKDAEKGKNVKDKMEKLLGGNKTSDKDKRDLQIAIENMVNCKGNTFQDCMTICMIIAADAGQIAILNCLGQCEKVAEKCCDEQRKKGKK